MKNLFNQRTTYTVLFYILVILLIIISKPSFIFNDQGLIKPFGVGGDDKTIVSLGVMVVVLSIVSFYMFACIDVVFAKKECS
jgi:hypothetical protein